MKSKYLVYILFSAPGIIIHEFSHQLFCALSGVKVFKVKYFQLKNPSGYVEHAQPRNFIQAFFISVGPFIFGTLLAFLLFAFAVYETKVVYFQYSVFNIQYLMLNIISLWFGSAIAVNCFPSGGDAKVLLSEARHHVFQRFNPFALLLFPFIWIIQLANYLKKWYFDWIYAILILVISVYVV